jgi:signal transduction histidine kinase
VVLARRRLEVATLKTLGYRRRDLLALFGIETGLLGIVGGVLEVADEGAGIPPAQLPQLFDRFYRVRADRKTKGAHGLGLGLSIVKGIVEAHGGKVSATNRPGGGACFTFTLPLTQRMEHE